MGRHSGFVPVASSGGLFWKAKYERHRLYLTNIGGEIGTTESSDRASVFTYRDDCEKYIEQYEKALGMEESETIEIKQADDAANSHRGKWYITRGVAEYMYPDGEFYFGCMGREQEKGMHGYYATRAEAAAVLFDYYHKRAEVHS